MNLEGGFGLRLYGEILELNLGRTLNKRLSVGNRVNEIRSISIKTSSTETFSVIPILFLMSKVSFVVGSDRLEYLCSDNFESSLLHSPFLLPTYSRYYSAVRNLY